MFVSCREGVVFVLRAQGVERILYFFGATLPFHASALIFGNEMGGGDEMGGDGIYVALG
jgi:hypothetical protein